MTRTAPMDRTSWYGDVGTDAERIADRLRHDFPVGSHIAVSAVVGGWSHDLSIEKVEDVRVYAPDHLSIVTHRYVRQLYGEHRVTFDQDYRGKRCEVKGITGGGEPLCWIVLAVEAEL